jgi:hypothetical protein
VINVGQTDQTSSAALYLSKVHPLTKDHWCMTCSIPDLDLNANFNLSKSCRKCRSNWPNYQLRLHYSPRRIHWPKIIDLVNGQMSYCNYPLSVCLFVYLSTSIKYNFCTISINIHFMNLLNMSLIVEDDIIEKWYHCH